MERIAFLWTCQRRGFFAGAGLDALVGDGGGPRLDEIAQSAEERFGSGLFELPGVERAGPAGLAAALARCRVPGAALDVQAGAVESLGVIHERLLGKRLARGKHGGVRVVKSARAKHKGGVFYTPACVARYVVENSVEEGRQAEILDPACGSGAFLLAACRRLLGRGTGRGPADGGELAAERIFGVDVDPEAVLAARRSVWLEIASARPDADRGRINETLADNIRAGDVLLDPVPEAWVGRFDAVVGNPPYRRELNSKALLDRIADTELGRRYRAPRMDLWYYFVHRALELLEPGGRLSFVVGSYWTSGRGAEKLIGALEGDTHVEEIFLLDRLKVFQNVAGRHMIFRARKGAGRGRTTIKRAAAGEDDVERVLGGDARVTAFGKSAGQLFREGRIDVEPPCDELLAKLDRWSPLGSLGKVRQGIAENPAAVTRRTNEKHGNRWRVGEGVFVLTAEELAGLGLSDREMEVVRPYHGLRDLGRYFLARLPSRALVYSTAQTWPTASRYPTLGAHLERFRPIMEARRETRRGVRPWWQLHWPREAGLWESAKIVSVQMARRPAFVAAEGPVYVSFSANVFVPGPDVGEHLNYVAALLNSRLLWKWYEHHAKRRGVGLEINGHVLGQTPIRTIDFSSPTEKACHDRLVRLVDRVVGLNRELREVVEGARGAIEERIGELDREIDAVVYGLYGVSEAEMGVV